MDWAPEFVLSGIDVILVDDRHLYPPLIFEQSLLGLSKIVSSWLEMRMANGSQSKVIGHDLDSVFYTRLCRTSERCASEDAGAM